MTTPKPSHLRQTHPNLWFAVNVFGIWGLLTAINFLLGNKVIPDANLRFLFAGGYFAFASMKLVGANFSNISVARAGMVGCMLLSTLVATAYLIANIRHEISNFSGVINFFFLGVIQLAAISEPSLNPLTMKTSKDGKI